LELFSLEEKAALLPGGLFDSAWLQDGLSICTSGEWWRNICISCGAGSDL